MKGFFLFLGLMACAAAAGEFPGGFDAVVRDFSPSDPGRDRWTDAAGRPLALGVIDAEHGDSLLVPADFPGTAEAWRGGPSRPTALARNGWLAGQPSQIPEEVRFDVYVPPGLPAGARVQARLTLKNKDGLWFDALGRREAVRRPDGTSDWVPAHALHPGWNRLKVDLRETSVEVRPRGHGMAWSRYALSQIRALAVVFQGDRRWSGALAVDNIVMAMADDHFAAPFRLVEFEPPDPAAAIPAGGLAVWRTRLNRPPLNPFRVSEISVDVEIAAPGAEKPFVLPAFYDIPHTRSRGSDGPGPSDADPDVWTPAGVGFFEARYRPMAPGIYRWKMRARYVSPVSGVEETAESPEGGFVAGDFPAPAEDGAGERDAARRRGFARVSRKDSRYFEFWNGDFFFPVGHSFRSPNDPRHAERILRPNWPEDPAPPDRDLRAYEDILPRMRAAGLNVFEVWMASWWLDLEWSPDWKRYHGIHGYNLANAHRLDALLDLADRHGQYIHLTLDNHGKAAQNQRENDPEWDHSPYNRANGGWLERAAEVFTDERARELHRDKLRYVAARWGHSPRIFAWELWSELDLTGGSMRDRRHYAGEAVHDWHREMASHLLALDQGARPITTHYSGNYEIVDWTMFARPFIHYAAFDAYADHGEPLVEFLRLSERRVQTEMGEKPFFITEYGGGAYAAKLPRLAAHQYAGLWWGWHSRSAGTPLFWWYELAAKADYYPAYRALANYIAGEDKRRGPDEPPLVSRWPYDLVRAEPVEDGAMAALILADGNVYYAWVYDKRNLEDLPPDRGRETAGMVLRLGSTGPGKHAAEIWDCWTGEAIRAFAVEADARGVLRIPLPAFRSQIAVKIKAAAPRDRPTILDAPRPATLPPDGAGNLASEAPGEFGPRQAHDRRSAMGTGRRLP